LKPIDVSAAVVLFSILFGTSGTPYHPHERADFGQDSTYDSLFILEVVLDIFLLLAAADLRRVSFPGKM